MTIHPIFKYGLTSLCLITTPLAAQVTAHGCEDWSFLFVSRGYDRLQECLDQGADVNSIYYDEDGPERFNRRLIHIAVSGDLSINVLNVLLAAGADIEIRNDRGWTPLHDAVVPPHMLGYEDEIFYLSEALVNAGADVNARDPRGRTPVHFSAAFHGGTPRTLSMLLEAGGDIHVRDNNGNTPLHFTVGNWGSEHTTTILLEAGADVNARNNDGDTPLHMVMDGPLRDDTIAVLLQAGADINAQNNDGDTPLHHAATRSNELPAMMALLEAGVDIETRNNRGQTALHAIAAAEHRFDFVTRDPNFTPSSLSIYVNALLDAGANPAAQDADGNYPFDLIPDDSTLIGKSAYQRLRDGRPG
jgi:ankyrin repeat protein